MFRYIGLLVAAMLLAGIATPDILLAQAPAQPVIREIVFRGFEHISQEARQQVQDAVTSKVGQPYSKEKAQQDVEAILGLGWFFTATTRTEPVDGGVRLVFVIEENPVIASVEFLGNTQLSDEALLKVIRTKPGEVLNRDQVAPDALAIKEAYAKAGYTMVEVTDISISDDGKLQFFIFEPRVGEIRIEGNKKTRDYVIRREMEVQPNDVYNEKTVRRSLYNLERLGIFDEVTALPKPGTEPGTLTVVFNVKERKTGVAAVGVGHSNIQGLIGFVDVADTNFRGTGQRLSARIQFGADDSYNLSYTNPWIGKKRTSATINLYDRTILRQAVGADETFVYHEQRTGGNVMFGRPIREDTTAYLSLRVDRIGAEDADIPDVLKQTVDVRSIGLSAVRDTRNSVLSPSDGMYASLGSEFAGLMGGADFTKFTGELRRYWNLRRPKTDTTTATATTRAAKPKPPLVFAVRVQGGITSGTPPPLDQFLVGGADTLRGFKEDRFPGKNMVLANTELRVPLNDTLQVVAFADAGDAWGGAFAEEFGNPEFKLHFGYGLGVRVQTPIGPLRLDYGFSGEGGSEFHFGVGSTF